MLARDIDLFEGFSISAQAFSEGRLSVEPKTWTSMSCEDAVARGLHDRCSARAGVIDLLKNNDGIPDSRGRIEEGTRGGRMGEAAERRLVQLAARQFGIVTVYDLAACGISWQWLRHRLRTGEWMQIHRATFRLGSTPLTLDELEMAAILAAGADAVLSHASAARRLGVDVPRDQSVHIMVPAGRRGPKLDDVRVWRSRDLVVAATTRRGPFRMTDLARTMMDLAPILDDDWLRASLDSVLRNRRTSLARLSRALTQRAGHPGTRRLRSLLNEYRREDDVSDSVLESFGLEMARATGRKPKLHLKVRDGARFVAEVDLAWPEVRLCVELDGWMHHGTRAAFVADRARDRDLCGLGWMVLRYTWQDVTQNREDVIQELAAAYDQRAAIFSAPGVSRHLLVSRQPKPTPRFLGPPAR